MYLYNHSHAAAHTGKCHSNYANIAHTRCWYSAPAVRPRSAGTRECCGTRHCGRPDRSSRRHVAARWCAAQQRVPEVVVALASSWSSWWVAVLLWRIRVNRNRPGVISIRFVMQIVLKDKTLCKWIQNKQRSARGYLMHINKKTNIYYWIAVDRSSAAVDLWRNQIVDDVFAARIVGVNLDEIRTLVEKDTGASLLRRCIAKFTCVCGDKRAF